MKHAYLIIAHNEFEVLSYLLKCLDDIRHDIFIHFDKKVKEIPKLNTENSNLYILENRIDVRWGHSSQVDVELELFSVAENTGEYSFFHLISGVHLPLYKPDYLFQFFESRSHKSFIMRMETSEREISLKMRYYHFFIKNFIHKNSFLQRLDQLAWHILLKIQQVLGLNRNRGVHFSKASQWVSLNHDAVSYLLNNKEEVKSKYRFTFCADEFFVLSELENSAFKESIVDESRLLSCEFTGTSPRIYTSTDYERIMNSSCLFARKFSSKHLAVVQKITENLKLD